ncbi:MAG: hypothetical protein KAI66_16400 [Lentisphaeria bacterium]|nr:hypothetical protein [Lentisphaeria bacterium]
MNWEQAEAMRQEVRRVREIVLARSEFRGYSGRAKMVGGAAALGAAALMHFEVVPRTTEAHLRVWGMVCAFTVLANYGAVAYWFLKESQGERDWMKLSTMLDPLPSLVVGGILTLALLGHGQHDLLFGTWMCIYGLVHTVHRTSLPPPIYAIGPYYVICGSVCLLLPGTIFLNPWPMGIVFFVGELLCGLLIVRARR